MNALKILVFAPHNDDEVLGVGGTIAKYTEQGHHVTVCEVTSGSDVALVNRIKREALNAHKILGAQETIFLELPVVGLKETSTVRINKAFCDVVQQVRPNMAFIPHIGDLHIDHQEVAKAAMVALRPIENVQLSDIYIYETLSETEWNIPTVNNAFTPMVWSDITSYIDLKLDAMNCYESQLKQFPHPRSLEAIKALAQFRGSNVGRNYAESFMCVRSII